ncbi:MAG TPA: SDR family NAD(P)-dependent oxidoreductase [Nocardioidaceae bacterium]|nr:SDR family NAD(P)-dependent oxidoreductase [Nocardioidaceae bacterium]
MITFADQVVLVTGAGRGLGASYARLLAARGATVVVHDAGVERDGSGQDPGPAGAVAESILADGGQAEAETQNLADRKGCTDLVSSVLQRHGRIDALIHSAGIVRYHGIAETTDRDWQRMLDVNVSAAWWLCQAVWPGMVARRYGRIVLTTSGFALRVVPGADVTGYSVGKAAQFGLMNALASEGEPSGILVNALAPVAATRIFRRAVGSDEMSPDAVAPRPPCSPPASAGGTARSWSPRMASSPSTRWRERRCATWDAARNPRTSSVSPTTTPGDGAVSA